MPEPGLSYAPGRTRAASRCYVGLRDYVADYTM
jgi:hypothetical protein